MNQAQRWKAFISWWEDLDKNKFTTKDDVLTALTYQIEKIKAGGK